MVCMERYQVHVFLLFLANLYIYKYIYKNFFLFHICDILNGAKSTKTRTYIYMYKFFFLFFCFCFSILFLSRIYMCVINGINALKQYKKYTKIGQKMVFFQNPLIKKYCFLVEVDMVQYFAARILANLNDDVLP